MRLISFVLLVSVMTFIPHTGYANEERQRFIKLLDEMWEWRVHRYPEFATSVSYPGQNDRWTDLSEQALAAGHAQTKLFLKQLNDIKREILGPRTRLSYDLMKAELELDVAGQAFPQHYLQINQLGGIHQSAEYTLSISPQRTVKDFENIISRLEKLPHQIKQTQKLLEKGMQSGITPSQITLREIPNQIDGLLNTNITEGALYKAFTSMPKRISQKQQKRLRKKAKTVLKNEVYPAYQELKNFIATKYIPNARTSIALSDMPNGKAWYQYQIKIHTSTNQDAKTIHKIGLKEVKRIYKEMRQIIKETGFEGDYKAFSQFINKDPRFFFTEPEQLLIHYRDIAKRADAEILRLFKTLPRLTYGIKAIPSYAEKSAPAAYYYPGSHTEGRPGYFMANTYNLAARPKWEMTALALHEAVPGHHLQIAIAQELPDVHKLRRYTHHTAFVEGWALYAESLGAEMGLYKDPYSRFGQLTYEMWRAIRLVVDTGMHSLGWTRQQAIDYFKQYSAKPEHDIIVEVDRYIVWPGQALAYKTGELKIQALRQYAEEMLGAKFDLREFHDQVLAQGSVPLEILEQNIHAWVKKVKMG